MTEQEAKALWKTHGLGETFWTFKFALGVEQETLKRVISVLEEYGLEKDFVTERIRLMLTSEAAPAQGADTVECAKCGASGRCTMPNCPLTMRADDARPVAWALKIAASMGGDKS